jgi:hypothetical protein
VGERLVGVAVAARLATEFGERVCDGAGGDDRAEVPGFYVFLCSKRANYSVGSATCIDGRTPKTV